MSLYQDADSPVLGMIFTLYSSVIFLFGSFLIYYAPETTLPPLASASRHSRSYSSAPASRSLESTSMCSLSETSGLSSSRSRVIHLRQWSVSSSHFCIELSRAYSSLLEVVDSPQVPRLFYNTPAWCFDSASPSRAALAPPGLW